MSEIASKPNTGPSASLAQPFAKKSAGAEHDLLFAALFGGVVVLPLTSGKTTSLVVPHTLLRAQHLTTLRAYTAQKYFLHTLSSRI